MEFLRSACYFVVVLSVLVVAHEWGHFIVAKLFRMRVEDFSLFFGKKLFSLGVRHGTEYNVRSIPLGGFVKIAGMEPDDISNGAPIFRHKVAGHRGPAATLRGLDEARLEDIDSDQISDRIYYSVGQAIGKDSTLTGEGKLELQSLIESVGINKDEQRYLEVVLAAESYRPDPDAFSQKPLWQRALVIGAGPFMSLFTGYILLVVMGFSIGLPSGARVESMVEGIVAGKPAARAGIRPGDRIVAIDGIPVRSGEDLVGRIHSDIGRPLLLSIDRGGKSVSVVVTPEQGTVPEFIGGKPVNRTVGLIGIMPKETEIWGRSSPAVSAKAGGRFLVRYVTTTLRTVFSRHAGDNVGGIITIGKQIHEDSKEGPRKVMLTAALLSLSLGIINLFPIPVLDGGHLMLLAWEGLRRRRLSSREVYTAQVVGISIIGVLFVLVMYKDILRILPGGAKP